MKKKYYLVIGIACIFLVLYFINWWFWSIQIIDPGAGGTVINEEYCMKKGGTVKTQLCCLGIGDLPNTCLIGACGCSPENSHEVKVCDCGEGKCWNMTECISNSNP